MAIVKAMKCDSLMKSTYPCVGMSYSRPKNLSINPCCLNPRSKFPLANFNSASLMPNPEISSHYKVKGLA